VSAPDAAPIERLAAFAAGSGSLALDEVLVPRTQLLVLDTLGCAVLAAHLEPTEALLATLQAGEPAGPSRLWFHDGGLSPANAAMLNATAVHGFELDDITTSLGHYGSVTVPVALALADAGHLLSGAALLRAVVVGIEVGLRVNECVGGVPHLQLGFHGPSVFGTFAAAATAGAVLGLSPAEMTHALCHAAQFTAGLMGAQHGGMGKRLLPGRAAHSGILAAGLAAHGFTSTPALFARGYGSFPEAFSGGGEGYDLARLAEGLGSDLRAHKVNFKLWACRIPIHPSLEAIRQLRAATPFAAEEVERLEVALTGGAFRSVGHPYRPDTVASAQLNLQYCVAMMLLEGDVFEQQFRAERLRDPAVLDLAARVRVRHDPRLDDAARDPITQPSLVEMTLADGRRLRGEGFLPGATAPVPAEVVLAKFQRMCEAALEKEHADELAACCLDLEHAPDLRALSALLAPTR